MRKTFLIIVLALVVASCADGGFAEGIRIHRGTTQDGTTTRPSLPRLGVPNAALVALSTVNSCDQLLEHFQAEALERVGPWGLGGYGDYYPVAPGGVVEDRFDTFAAATEAPATGDGNFRVEGVDFSGTNTQERAVDEPDIVKTDGKRIFAIISSDGRYYEEDHYGGYYGGGAVLVAIEVTDRGPKLAGRLNLRRGWGHEMFLVDDRVYVISNGSRPSTSIAVAPNIWDGDYFVPQVGATLVSEIDASNLGEMEVTRDLYFDGTYVSSRLTDGTARIVIRTQPTGLQFVQPKGSGLRAERQAETENRRIIEESTIENWLPYYVLEDHRGSVTAVTEGTLLDCSDVYLPDESAGLGLTAVLTLDTDHGIAVGDAAAIFAQGDTIYASTDNLYIATNPWVEPALFEDNWRSIAREFATTIHRFDTQDPGRISYEGSGAVAGYLLNQFAMSEHEGYLRVASTDAAGRWGFSDEQQSFISTIDIETMETTGRVGELGRGEQIYSVRFIGDSGFVVTFRQVDPLYTVDLTDPKNPVVLGELKIPGYSSYLHPVGEDRLLGIGQAATMEGSIQGTQVSLFDISDLSHPQLISKLKLGDGSGGSSEVEYDHHAFLYWAPADLAVLPLQRWSWNGSTDSYFSGAVGVHVDRDGLGFIGEVAHQSDHDYWEYGSQIRRSLVIGDDLYTISDRGVKASTVDNLDAVAWVPFSG